MTPSSQPDGIAAVVVAYRSAGTLGDCLAGLLDDPAVREVVVVDNSSEAEAASVVARLDGATTTRLDYVDAGVNLGFAAACNLGVTRSGAGTIALVNPDVRLTRSLGGLVELLGAHPGSAIAGGLLDETGRIGNARADSTLRVEVRRSLTGTPPALTVPTDGAVHGVEQVDGALLLVDRRTWWDAGGLAELFPLYYEDVELCWRLRRAGGSVLLHALAYGTHAGGVSSAQNPLAYRALRVSRLRWMRLRYGALGAAAAVGITALEVGTRGVGRKPEGGRTRRSALRACAVEWRRPLSQRPLNPPQPT